MSFGRFVLPVVPLLVVLTVVAGMDMVAAAFRSRTILRWLAPIAPLAAGSLMAVHMDHRTVNNGMENGKVAGVADQTNNVQSYLRAADFLGQVVPTGARLVTDYGGVFACYTDGALIEMWGLANATIATRGDTEGVLPIYGKTCAACYPELQPEYFHVMQPMVRKESPTEHAFKSTDDVIANVTCEAIAFCLAIAALTASRANGGIAPGVNSMLSRAYQSENSRYCTVIAWFLLGESTIA